MKKTIVSGIQPTGNLHIGNYLGAIKNWVDLQNSGDYTCFFFIADYHSLTGNQTAKERSAFTVQMAAELIAAGIDPKKSTLFVQSFVPEHTELAWIFNCVTPISELERMTQFKDKSARQHSNINTGLFAYPVLQSADILLYKGTHVPVGEDQVQHVELTRKIARWFNKKYKNIFPETEHILTQSARVMSLLAPDKKMSKSLGENHVVELDDAPKVIERKIKRAVTATSGGSKAPGVENLLSLFEAFGDMGRYKEFAAAEKKHEIRYGDLKKELALAIASTFETFRETKAELLTDPDHLADILSEGSKRAQELADMTIQEVRKVTGIRS